MPHPSDVVVHTLEKNAREEVRIALTHFEGHDLLDVRIYFRSKDGDMRPTPKGIAIDRSRVADLIAGLEAARLAAGMVTA